MKDDQLEFSLGDSIKAGRRWRTHGADDNRFIPHPLEEAKQATVDQIIRILEEEEAIREKVFSDLYATHRNRIDHNLSDRFEQTRSEHLAFYPKMIDESDEEEKSKAREELRAEINMIQSEISKNKRSAGNLLCNAVWYAKHIGDRLLFVKAKLLEYGEYEDWVKENFSGGLSTARAYTRIARYKNWQKIAHKLNNGKLTIEGALALLRERHKDEEKGSKKRDNRYKSNQDSKGWQLWKMRKLVRLRLAVQRQLLSAYVENADGSLTPRPLSELI